MDTTCKVHEDKNLMRHLLSISFQPDTQCLLVSWQNEVRIPLLCLHHAPGTFDRGKSVSSEIFWQPSIEDNEEGHWLQTEWLHLYGRVIDENVDLEASDVDDAPAYHHESLLSETQDDNGALTRMIARSRTRGGLRPRSSSQPVLTHGREIHREYCSPTHAWMPNYHFCISRSAWILSCQPHQHGQSCLHRQHEFDYSTRDLRCDVTDLRRCVKVTASSTDRSEVMHDTISYDPFARIGSFSLYDIENRQRIFTHF